MSSSAFARRRLTTALLATTLCVAASAARADTITVNVDQAKIVKLPDRVSTIVIGNPLIADGALQAGGILVVTGKGFGATNLVAMDRQGRVVLDKVVQVSGPANGDVVTVYKGVARETYSCSPDCSPRITLGDSADYFGATAAQIGARNGQAAGGGGGAK